MTALKRLTHRSDRHILYRVVTEDEIRSLVDEVAAMWRPDKIILFGSYAGGEPGQDSDVDLLIVTPHAGKAWEHAARIRSGLRIKFPVDILVRSPDEIASRAAAGDLLITDILRKGVVLHEASSK